MTRTCTVCAHESRPAIDRALVGGGEPLRTIADLWSVSKTALVRHKDAHLPTTLTKARAAREVATADDLLAQVRALQGRTMRILEGAESAGDLRVALGAIAQARGNLELLAKLVGKLDEKPQVNVLVSAEWLRIRTVVVAALEPFPSARLAVVESLREVGHPE